MNFTIQDFGTPIALSAANASGVGDVLDAIYEHFPENNENNDEDEVIKVAIIGKPNTGKSSLVNKILGSLSGKPVISIT